MLNARVCIIGGRNDPSDDFVQSCTDYVSQPISTRIETVTYRRNEEVALPTPRPIKIQIDLVTNERQDTD